MQLKIGTKSFERFTKVPIPLTVKFYLFNVTNSEQVLLGRERPQFQEVGPFMFKQWRRREVVDLEDYNRRLRYREYKTYYQMYPSEPISSASNNSTRQLNSDNNNIKSNQHDAQAPTTMPNNSNNTDNNTTTTTTLTAQATNPNAIMLDPHNVNVTIVNLPLLSVLTKLAQMEEGSLKRSLAAKVASRLIADGRDKILITRPVNELLFDGYKVDFMESARDLVSGTLGFNFESPLPRNKFGFFFMKNNTWTKKENGELTVFTGRNESMSDFMIVENWNDQRQLSVWPNNTEAGDRCNQIRGTDGSQFHPGVSKSQVLDIFSPMACTSVYIKFKEDTQTRDIPLYRFTTPAELFGAPKKSLRNACYCTIAPTNRGGTAPNTSSSVSGPNPLPGGSNGPGRSSKSSITDSRCYLDGLMDLSLCQRGAPIAASAPHFYNADPMLSMAAGLKPNKQLHETYIDIEPMTGAVFRAANRAQLNAFVEQAALEVVDSRIIGHMTPMVAPLLWFEEAAEIDEKSSNDFKSQLYNTVLKARRSFIYSICFGILLALVVCVQYWYVTCYLTRKGEGASDTVKKRQVKPKAERSETARRRPRRASGSDSRAKTAQDRREQRDANLLLGGGAKQSNLAALNKPMLPADCEPSSSSSVPSIAMAAVLAARTGRRRRRELGDGADDDELSKRMLVNDEWEPAAATNTSSSGRSSSRDNTGISRQDPLDASTSSGPDSN